MVNNLIARYKLFPVDVVWAEDKMPAKECCLLAFTYKVLHVVAEATEKPFLNNLLSCVWHVVRVRNCYDTCSLSIVALQVAQFA
jgi:hypothetical protein